MNSPDLQKLDHPATATMVYRLQTVVLLLAAAAGFTTKSKTRSTNPVPAVRRPQSSMWETSPSASFGSNQVDLGGMTSPTSATAMRSSMRVG